MKTPFASKEQLEKIIADVPTPFHIYDEKGIRENARALYDAFSWNKGFREYYAVKACANPEILRILKEEGCGCDCSSMAELVMAKAVGQDGEHIFFSSNDTPSGEYTYANKIGAFINFDDITMIDFYEKEVGTFPEKICCRFNPGGTYHVSNNIMDNPGEAKYGMTEDQMTQAFRILKNKGVKDFGIHAFLVSNANTEAYYPSLAKTLFKLAVRLKKATGVHIAFINLSGGIGIPYHPDDKPISIREVGDGVKAAFEEILVPEGMDDVSIYTELGRYMTGPYGGLVTKAIHVKHIQKEYIGVDACAANLMRPAMYGAYHHITVMGKETWPEDHRYDIVGSLCENNDKFAVDRWMQETKVGDILFIHDTGAHGFSMGYNYNGKLRSAEVLLLEDGSHKLIRRAETLQDYYETFSCTPEYEALLAEAENV